MVIFHEGMSLTNRDRAAAYFADMHDGAQALICSEIGSEGRNFQFAASSGVVRYSAVAGFAGTAHRSSDRIGQTETIHLHAVFSKTARHSMPCCAGCTKASTRWSTPARPATFV